MITREMYMKNSKELHNDYYEQFVTNGTMNVVRIRVNIDAIRASTDPYFNDIDLYVWDCLIGWRNNRFVHERTVLPFNEVRFKQANGKTGYSCSDMICIAKAAARMIKQNLEEIV